MRQRDVQLAKGRVQNVLTLSVETEGKLLHPQSHRAKHVLGIIDT